MHTLTGTRAPIRMWTDPDTVEPGALTQLRNCAQLPWTHGVAVMPDVHQGYGATVGSVVAMRDAVSPGAVGVDIGCGMSAVRTDLVANDLPDSLAPVRAQVERDVPVGRAGHRDAPRWAGSAWSTGRAGTRSGRGSRRCTTSATRPGRPRTSCWPRHTSSSVLSEVGIISSNSAWTATTGSG